MVGESNGGKLVWIEAQGADPEIWSKCVCVCHVCVCDSPKGTGVFRTMM